MLSRPIPITDHRGQKRTLWPQALTPKPGSDPESRHHSRQARRIVWRNLDHATRRRIRWMLFGGAVLIIGLTLHLVFFRGPKNPAFPPFFWAFYFIAAVFTTWRTAITARSSSICNDLLARRLCPACGYNLYGLEPDPAPNSGAEATSARNPDGCTTCPECGAAWRIPPSPP